MENIGVKREIDGNGRLCIPKEMRTLLKLENEVELVATKDGVLIRNPRYVLVERKDLIKNTDKR
jgi:bifunctional DNA-binding transcriptional regulator/antitoxin component of YhaV-PrlF toxin-antitoxin module